MFVGDGGGLNPRSDEPTGVAVRVPKRDRGDASPHRPNDPMRHNPPMPSDPELVASSTAVAGTEVAVAHALRVAAADAATQDYPPATLYVIATPIGNRADITVRAIACLARVDAIAAEDTRTARALLRHYGIDRPMIAAHRHNEREVAAALAVRIAAGERIAYVSDAGTPGVSDPGARLVAAVRDAGLRVMPIPGASALTTAVCAAGLPDGPLLFVGFLPSKAAQATTLMRSLVATPTHLVFYEAPHRIAATLAALATVFAGRHCVIARELTKRFETIHRCAVDDAAGWIAADPNRARGEFVVIVEADLGDGADVALQKALGIVARLSTVLPVSRAAALAAEISGVSRKLLYARALALRDVPGDVPGDVCGDVPGDVPGDVCGDVPGDAANDVPGDAAAAPAVTGSDPP